MYEKLFIDSDGFVNRKKKVSKKKKISNVKILELAEIEEYFVFFGGESDQAEPQQKYQNILDSYLAYPWLYQKFFYTLLTIFGSQAESQNQNLLEFLDQKGLYDFLAILHEIENVEPVSSSQKDEGYDSIPFQAEDDDYKELYMTQLPLERTFNYIGFETLAKIKPKMLKAIFSILDKPDDDFIENLINQVINPKFREFKYKKLLYPMLQNLKKRGSYDTIYRVYLSCVKSKDYKTIKKLFEATLTKTIRQSCGTSNRSLFSKQKRLFLKKIYCKSIKLKKNRSLIHNKMFSI